MEKTKKILVIGGIIALLIAVYYFFIRSKADKVTTQPDEGATTPPVTKPTAGAKLPNADFPLQSGSYGQQVQHVQIAMNLQNGAGLDTDGRMGPQTIAALNKYYPKFGGRISYANYMMIFNRYGVQIMNFLKSM